MKVCIFGAGAIGGLIGARLCQAGNEATLIARGPHLAAMQSKGLTILSGEGRQVIPVTATDDPAGTGPQDTVIVTLKAHVAAQIVDEMSPLLGPETTVLTAMNGLPWWYFHDLDGPWRDHTLESVDPGGRQADLIGGRRVLGCVVYLAAELVEPGVIRHTPANRIVLGEPDGRASNRLRTLCRLLRACGLDVTETPHIRDEIWLKLLGNLTFNSVSALTHETLSGMAEDPGTREVVRAMMVEAMAVADCLGVGFPIDAETRIEQAREIGPHKTSMLQDLERGRSMEIDPMVGSVQEVARMVGVATPTLDTVLALVRQRARLAGCYQAQPPADKEARA